MTSLEHEIIEKISRLDSEKQQRVLDFVRSLEEPQQAKAYSLDELVKMPPEERSHAVAQALALSADEDFEIFEAYSEEDIDASA
jgi:hypothetical protein